MSRKPYPRMRRPVGQGCARSGGRTVLLRLALQRHDAGDHSGAASACRDALEQEPDCGDALHLLGVQLTLLGDLSGAEAALSSAMRLAPGSALVLFARGSCRLKAGRLKDAASDFTQAAALDPTHLPSHLQCARVLLALEEFEAAEQHGLRAKELDPRSAEAHRTLGKVLVRRRRLQEAVAALRESVALDPKSAEGWNELGEALLRSHALEEAGRAFLTAIGLSGKYPAPHVGLAKCLMRAGYPKEAVRKLQSALPQTDRSPAVLVAMANLLRELGELDAARRAYEGALAAQPDSAIALYNLARLDFERLDFEAAWRSMPGRWKSSKIAAKALETTRPQWQGAPDGGPLLVWGEQGLGDHVLYASMLSDLQALPREKIVAVDPRLIPLFERSLSAPGMRFIDRYGDPLPESEYAEQIAMGDLGRYFRNRLEDFRRARSPFLEADPGRVASYAGLLRAPGAPLVCGLAWRSKNLDVADEKSLGGRELYELVADMACRFVNLQYGDVRQEIDSMRGFGVDLAVLDGLDLKDDIDGLAAAIMACDLVVTTSNSTAHIAGALGKRTLLMLPKGRGQFWYWQPLGDGSIWYPSVRVLRQERAGDWSGPISAVRRLLKARHD